MKQKIYFLTILICTCGLFAYGQDTVSKDIKNPKSKFSLLISTSNHAELLFNGTMIYNLTNNTLTIHRETMFSDKDTILFSKKLDTNSIEQIRNIQLDSLKDHYFNYCIMPTSGNEYFISTTIDTVTKNISLHHFYNKQIKRLINELNKNIPDNFKIDYLSKDTKQDCKM